MRKGTTITLYSRLTLHGHFLLERKLRLTDIANLLFMDISYEKGNYD